MKTPSFFVGLALLAAGFAYAGKIVHVAPGGLASDSGLTWAEATSLERALVIALPGDEVWLKEGTYVPGGGALNADATFAVPADVSLYGGFAGTETARAQRNPAAHPAVISGDLAGDDIVTPAPTGFATGVRGTNAWIALTVAGGSQLTTLDGLQVRGTRANASGGRIALSDFVSEGAYGLWATGCEELLVSRARFVRSFGVQVTGGDCTVEYCLFDHNGDSACYFGDGGSVTVRACQFVDNVGENHGAGVNADNLDRLEISGCRFLRHRLTARETRIGGALRTYDVRDLKIEGSEFQNSSADRGGAVSLERSAGTMDRVRFINNTDGHLDLILSTLSLSNATFSGEDGAIGVHHGSSLTVVNSTFAVPLGGAYNGSSATVRNCIVADVNHTFATPAFGTDESSTLTFSHCIVTGGVPGEGNLDADPLFVGPVLTTNGPDDIPGTGDDVAEDLRLQPGSPAIGAGSSTPPLPRVDLDGLSRQIGVVDLGAYEFAPDRRNYDTDGDGQPDILESAAGTDPFRPDDLFRFDVEFADGQFRLEWPPVAGRTYTVQSSADLLSWTDAATFCGSETGAFRTAPTARGFHRLRVREGF